VRKRKGIGLVLLILTALILTIAVGCSKQAESVAAAPSYPEKSIIDICPVSAGGASDLSQRLMGSIIPKYLNGKTLIVENKPGGASVIGTNELAKAKPDGYTIGMVWGASFTLRPYVMEVPYKMDDFEYIIGMFAQRNCLVVRADSPYKKLSDLIDAAKAAPGKLTYGGSTAASYQSLVGSALNKAAGIKTTYVPADGTKDAVVALIGNHLDYVVCEPAAVASDLAAGTLVSLCVFEDAELPILPGVPTARSLGFDVAYPHTMMMCAPKGTPPEITKILHDAIKATLEDPEFIKLATKAGLEIKYQSGADVKAETEAIAAQFKVLAKEALDA